MHNACRPAATARLTVAHGLSPEWIRDHWKEIDRVNQLVASFRILRAGFQNLIYGVAMGRRGWLTSGNVLNSASLPDFSPE